MKKITVPMTEEEQAQAIQRHTAMKEVAWQAFSHHYNSFAAVPAGEDDEEKDYQSQRMYQWMTQYRDLEDS